MDYSYIAGFIDGEGSIWLRHDGNFRRWRISFTQQYSDALNQIKEFLKIRNKLYYFQAKSGISKGRYYYHLNIDKRTVIHQILKNCMPHLILKKEQAQKCLDNLNDKNNWLRGWKGDF